MRFIAVYKTGGDYTGEDVTILCRQVHKYCPRNTIFTVLSDSKETFEADEIIPLTDNLPGWWSLIEAFKVQGACMLTGLDTILVDKFPKLLRFISLLSEKQAMMLSPFNPLNMRLASGIMGWNGNVSFLHKEFKYERTAKIYKMEQDYSYDGFKKHDYEMFVAQKAQKGIYSYKHHCRKNLPSDATIVLFHGRPRPSEVTGGWVVEHRRKFV